jgi:hypothetical protein
MEVRLSALRTRCTLLSRNIISFMFLVLISVRGYICKKRTTVGRIDFNAVCVISKGLLFTQFLIKINIHSNPVLTENMKRIINLKLRGISISWMNWTLCYKEQVALSVKCSRKKMTSVEEKSSVVATSNAIGSVTCFPFLRTEKPTDTEWCKV